VKSGKGVTSYKSDPESTEHTGLAPLSKSYIAYRKGLTIFRTGKYGQVYTIGNKTLNQTAIRGKTTKKMTRIKFAKSAFANSLTPPTLGEFGKPEKSNLTLSGQMLDAIMMSATEDGFKLVIANTRRRGSKLTNAQVADYVQNGGTYTNGNGKVVRIPARPFFALTAGEIRIITRELETIIRERIQAIAALRS
jgi:phage gpG-like protein